MTHETKSTPKPFSFAQITSYLLPSLPRGTTEVLDGGSHHTQGKESRPNPTSLLGIPVEANFLGRVNKEMIGPMTRVPSGDVVQQPKNAFVLIRSMARYRRSCRTRLQIMKKAGLEPQGPSNRLKSVGVLVMGSFSDHTARATAARNAPSALTEMAATFATMKPPRQIFGAHNPKHALKHTGRAQTGIS